MATTKLQNNYLLYLWGMNAFGRYVREWWPSMLTGAVILYMCLDSDPVGGVDLMWFPGADKVVHAVMFGGLAGAMCFDWQRCHRHEGLIGWRRVAGYALASLVFGIVIEELQGLMGLGRSADIWDAVGDGAGCLIAALTIRPVLQAIFHPYKNPQLS